MVVMVIIVVVIIIVIAIIVIQVQIALIDERRKKQENRFVFFQLDEENGILMNGEEEKNFNIPFVADFFTRNLSIL